MISKDRQAAGEALNNTRTANIGVAEQLHNFKKFFALFFTF